MMPDFRLSRRSVLRGLGVTMALPWLESLSAWAEDAAPAAAANEPPVRLAVLFAGNGFHSREWWAKGEGRDMQLGKVLEPLSDFREKMLFIRGLYNAEALKGNIHSSMTGNLLSVRALGRRRSDPLRHEHRPVAGPAARPGYESAEPRLGLREVDRVGAQELFDAL